jgi:hypothetical protein
LEDRRLLAGLNVFVYDDADQSGTWEQGTEQVLKEHVVFLDDDGNGKLGAGEKFAISDDSGKATFDDLHVGQALIRLFGSSGPGISITINEETEVLSSELAGASRPNNHLPTLGPIAEQSVDEDGELQLAAELLTESFADADNDTPAYFIVGTSSKGGLTWSVEDGGSYKPDSNCFGSDSIIVRAFDGSGWSDPVTIDISVKSVDDAPTAILFAGGSIPENVDGYVIGDFSLEDIDGGDYLIIFDPEETFEVQDGKLKLVAGKSLDFEASTSIDLTIIVQAGGSSLSGTYTLPIENRNDSPTALDFEGTFRVEEFEKGFQFGTVSVTDQDAGEGFTFGVSDNRFEVVDNILKLKEDASLFFADGSTIAVTVTATSNSNGDQISTPLDIEVVRATPPWQNKHWAMDVNDDGVLGPIDVLIVINALNRMGVTPLDRPPPAGSTTFCDVNGDRMLTPLDALLLINALNRQQNGLGSGSGPAGGGSQGNDSGTESEGGEGESSPSPQRYTANPGTDSSALMQELAVDPTSLPGFEDSSSSSILRRRLRV